jgi:hypothetical protein
MHQGLDLSKFKKVSSDKKTTVLRHAAGHEIRIAHGALTPKMREAIEKLEMHKGGKVKRLADGTPDAPVEPADADSPAETDDDSGPEDATPDQGTVPPDASIAPQAEDSGDDDQSDEAQPEHLPTEATAAPAAAPPTIQSAKDWNAAHANDHALLNKDWREEAPVEDPNAPIQVTTAQKMDADDIHLAQAIKTGQIKPETIQDLYAKKDTLGKIGTLFGLLVSGAGSGLAHQSNAVLDLMNKEIQNDFEAQKASNENAQNWLRLGQAHEMQKAQLNRMGTENELTVAQTGTEQQRQKLLEAETENKKKDSAIKDQTQAINRMRIGAVGDAYNKADKLPPGPRKDQYLAGAQALEQGAMAANAADNARTGAHLDARAKLRSQAAPDNGVNLQKLNGLIQQGKAAENLGVPAKMNSTEAAQAQKEAQSVADNRAIAGIYNDSYKKLDQAALAGRLNKQLRAAEINTLGAEIARATAGRFNAQESAAQADGMFPDATDWGGSRQEKYRKAMEHFKANEAGTVTLDRYGLKTPFPYSTAGTASSPDAAKKWANAHPNDPRAQKILQRLGK